MDENRISNLAGSLQNLDGEERINYIEQIFNLTYENRKGCEDLVRAKGHISLFKFLKSTDENLIIVTEEVLINLTAIYSDHCNRIFIDDEDVQPLFQLLFSSNNEILLSSLKILNNLIVSGDIMFFDYGIITSLLKSLDSKDRRTVGLGLLILSLIASGDVEQKQVVIDAGGLSYFTKFLNSSYPEIRIDSISALTEICNGTPAQCEKILGVELIPPLTIFLDMLLAPLDSCTSKFCKKLLNICKKSPEGDRMISTIIPRLETIANLDIYEASTLSSTESTTSEEDVEDDGPLSEIIETIYSTDVIVCKEAVFAIKEIASGSLEQKQEIIDANLIPRLVALLSFDDLYVRVTAAEALATITNGTHRQMQAVIDAGAILKLINQKGDENPLILQTALFVLGNIANGTRKQRQSLIDANIIHHIHSVLVGSEGLEKIYLFDYQIYEFALLVIRNISSGSVEEKQNIIGGNLITCLVKFLAFTENSNVCAIAAEALGNIAKGTEKQIQAVIDAGAIPLLINIVANEESDALKLCAVLLALKNISNGTLKQIQAIVDANVISYIYNLLNSPDAFISLQAINVLVRVTNNISPQHITLVVDCIEKISKELFRSQESEDGNFSYADICNSAALQNFYNTDLVQAHFRIDFISHLTKFLNPKYGDICGKAVIILADVFNTENGRKLAASSCLFPMVRLIGYPEFQYDVTVALDNITSGEEEERELVIQANILPTLMNLIKSKNYLTNETAVTTLPVMDNLNLKICANAIKIFSNMSMGIPNGANLVSEYVSVFVKLLDSPHNAIQNSSASVISNLCKGLPCHRQSVFSAGAIKSLIVLLADADTLENAIRAIANASYFYKHTEIQELVDAGVIGTMVKSLDSPFRLLASVILSNISAGGAKQSLIAEGAIPAMIKAFDYSDPEICFFLFSGLKNLITGNEKQRLFVVQNGVIHCLIKLLKFRASVEGALYALTIIANGTKDEKEILVNAGAVKVFLFSMLSSSEEKSIKEAASDISLSYNLEKNNAEIMNYLSSLDSNSRDRISNALVDIIEGNIEQEEAIIESIPYLVKLLDDKQLCEYAARAIKSLIKGTMIGLEKTVQQGVVSFLIKSFAVKNVNASKYAAEALKFMLTNELAHDMIMIQILADLKNELENILRTSSTEFEKICRKLVAYDFITVIQDLKDKENAVIKNHASTLLQLVDEIYVQKLGKTLLRRCPSLEAEINATNYTNAQFIPTSELPRGLVQMLRRCFAER